MDGASRNIITSNLHLVCRSDVTCSNGLVITGASLTVFTRVVACSTHEGATCLDEKVPLPLQEVFEEPGMDSENL